MTKHELLFSPDIEPRFDPRLRGPRLREEAKTITHMVHIYCRDKHGQSQGLCESCQGFLTYALTRLGRCPYQEKKPVCQKCKTHCYKNLEYKQMARDVMVYSGPRLMKTHPWLVIKHFWYNWTVKPPERVRNVAKPKPKAQPQAQAQTPKPEKKEPPTP